jgi:hypothetical protein
MCEDQVDEVPGYNGEQKPQKSELLTLCGTRAHVRALRQHQR